MYSADILENIIKRSENLLSGLKEQGEYPDKHKTLGRLWNGREVGLTLKITSATVTRTAANLIESGEMVDFAPDQKHPTTGQVLGYSLVQVNALRRHYKLMPERGPLDDCNLLAVQSFKGGVGKSMTTVHVAQGLASKGYRVLVVDMDPQASLTSLFGYVADLQIDLEDTLYPYFADEIDEDDVSKYTTLDYAVRKTYWEGIDLIPSQLGTNDIELILALQAGQTNEADRRELVFNKLQRGLDGLKPNYDVILLDCPPSLGIVTLNILACIDSVIIPTPPALFDFASTLQYLKMIFDIITRLDKEKSYKFIKILRTKSQNKGSHREFSAAMEASFGQYLMPCEFPLLNEVETATVEFKTFLEDRRPNKKALGIVQNVVDHVELEILKTWPSKAMEAAALEKRLNEMNEVENV